MKGIILATLASLWFGSAAPAQSYSEFAANQGNPILAPAGTENLTAFGSALKVGSTYYYYYMYSPDGTAGHAIGRATSTDGKIWTKDTANNPVLTKSVGGWDAGTIGVPSVWVEGSTWYMLYRGGQGPSGPFRGGLATSPDGVIWTRAPVNNCPGITGNGCVLDRGNVAGGTEDIEFYGVLKDPASGVYYAGIDNPGGINRAAGLATSTDLTTWTKNPANPLYTGGRYCTDIIGPIDGNYYQFVSHYIGGTSANAEIEVYRNSTPVFLPSTRQYIGIAVTQSATNGASDATNWDAYALDTPWVLTDDITRSSFAASNGDLWLYYAGSSTAAHTNFYTGIAVAGVGSFAKQIDGFFTKGVTTPGNLTVGGGSYIYGNANFASNVIIGGSIKTNSGLVVGTIGPTSIGAGLFITNTSMTMTSGTFGLTGGISKNGSFGTNGLRYQSPGVILQDATTVGTLAANYDNLWGGNTLKSSGLIITNEYGSYFKNPIAGLNTTFTNAYALGADSINSGSYAVGGVAGVTCPAGPPSSSFSITSGIVTHC